MLRLRQQTDRASSRAWSGWPDEVYRRQRFQQRLLVVQEHLAECLRIAPSGPLRIISMCAGDGRDVIGVLRNHPRQNDVRAWLVELNGESIEAGMDRASKAHLENSVRFLSQDATDYATYRQIAPANIILVCGVWGHVPADERPQLVQGLSTLCAPGGMVVWTCGALRGMARPRAIQSLFRGPAWEEVRVSVTLDTTWLVATHRYAGPRAEPPTSGAIFHFQRGIGR